MSASWLVARTRLRRRLLATILLTIFVGAAGAVVLAAAAGARRTQHALPAFEAFSHPPDVSLFQRGDFCTPALPPIDRIRSIPEVERADLVSDVIVETGTEGAPGGVVRRAAFLTVDGRPVTAFARPMVVAGRLPDASAPDEIAINEELSANARLSVGGRLRVATFTCAQFDAAGAGNVIAPAGAEVDTTVVGITRQPTDLAPVVSALAGRTADHGAVFLTPAFWSRYGPDLARYGVQAAVFLRNGSRDIESFDAHLKAAFGDSLQPFADPPLGSASTAMKRATQLESVALLLFAGIAAIAALFLVGQSAARQVVVESADYGTMRALGMTHRDLVVAAGIRVSIIAIGGALLAVLGAILLSPLAPIGLARGAELSPGLHADWLVLGVGALAVVVIVGVRALQPAWSAARRRTGGNSDGAFERPSKLAMTVERAGLPAPITTGTRFALEAGRSSRGVPTRTALAGLAVGVAAVVASVTVGASLTRLLSHPADYGVNWDAMVGNFADRGTYDDGARRLGGNSDVSAFAGVGNDTATVDGRSVEIVELQPERGSIWPTMTRGRPPALVGEVALGAKLMEQLHKDIGDTVVVSGPTGPGQTLQVVGETVVDLAPRAPEIEPGKAALLTLDTAHLLEPNLGVAGFAVQFAPGVARDAALDSLDASFPRTLTTPQPPPDLVNLRRIDRLPALLTLLVVILAVGTFAHTMSLSIRRRRREFAVLKSLGFVRVQVSTTVAWQATVSTSAAALIGIPLGIIAGRWLWIFIAGGLGVRSVIAIPTWSLLGIGLATLVVGNLVAVGPAWLAGRIHPAAALRSE